MYQPGNPSFVTISGAVIGEAAVDTGMKYVHTDGVVSPIFRKVLRLDATTSSLPNNTTKAVLHGETIALQKWCRVSALRADNGTTIKTEKSAGISFDVNATQVVVATTSDLTTYLRGVLVLEFCKS